MKKILMAAVAVVSLARSAQAESDRFYLGDGHSGAFTAATGTNTVNAYAALTVTAAVGDTSLTVGSATGFAQGDLVMVWQSTGTTQPLVAGSNTTIDLSLDPAGHYELARVASVNGTAIGLTAALNTGFPAGKSQVVKVPEYTTVNVGLTSTVAAQAWNGQTGGVVAFLAQGAVTVDGSVSATGSGFRGGLAVTASSATGCTELDGTGSTPSKWGQKGEGFGGASYYGPSVVARGNRGNGGGGGDCSKAGGAGGANGGVGFNGGNTATADGNGRSVGGMPGAAISASLLDHLLMGGGGGAGQGSGGTAGSGGNGGGAVFIRSASFGGLGGLAAAGNTPGNSASDGAGGGGAGGSIYLRATGTVTCLTGLSVTGGSGGGTVGLALAATGPGGGGGAGQILVQTPNLLNVCVPMLGSGAAGLSVGALGNYGATPLLTQLNGVYNLLNTALQLPLPPSITAPSNNAHLNNKRPTITGVAPLLLSVSVNVYVDGVYMASVTPDVLGNYSYTPAADWSEGSHQVQVSSVLLAFESDKSQAVNVVVDLSAPSVPVITTPSENEILVLVPLDVTGTGEPSTTLRVALDGTDVGVTTVDGTGHWHLLSTTTPALGLHVITAIDVDLAGNESPATPNRHIVVVNLPLDGGLPPLDGGLPPLDGGLPVDAGLPVTDSGTPENDAGTPENDAGTVVTDSGTPVTDAGHPATDAGHPATDAGHTTPAQDAGLTIDASTSVAYKGGGCSATPGGPELLGLLALVLKKRKSKKS